MASHPYEQNLDKTPANHQPLTPLTIVARAAAALGDEQTALGWLRTAAEVGTSPIGLASIIDGSPELIGIRNHPDVIAIRRDLAAAESP